MKAVQQPVRDRGYQNPGGYQKYHSGKKRIQGSEYLGCIADERVNRPHSPEYHRSVEEGIYPAKVAQGVITDNSDSERNRQD